MKSAVFNKKVAQSLGITIPKAKQAIEAVVSELGRVIENEDSIALQGFGTFSGVDNPERQGRNPATGESITIPAKTVPKFKAAPSFKERLKNRQG